MVVGVVVQVSLAITVITVFAGEKIEGIHAKAFWVNWRGGYFPVRREYPNNKARCPPPQTRVKNYPFPVRYLQAYRLNRLKSAYRRSKFRFCDVGS